MAVSTAAAEDEVTSSLWNEVANLLNGTSGGGQPVSFTQYASASSWGLTVRNQGSGGRHLRVLSADGTKTVLQATDAGLIANTGLIFRVEKYFADPTVTPSSSVDATAAIDAAIADADGASGGIVEFGPYDYGFSTINLTKSRTSGRRLASIVLRGVRGTSIEASTYTRGTVLLPNVAQGNSNAAKRRALIDCSGATYVSIEDMMIGGYEENTANVNTYGSGSAGGTASNVNPNIGILIGGVSGFETARVNLKNVLISGYFTSAALVVYGASNCSVTDCELYQSRLPTNSPTGTQGAGNSIMLLGRNVVNPDLPNESTADPNTSQYAAVSNYVTLLSPSAYVGCGQNSFINVQAWQQGSSSTKGAAIRLANSIGQSFLHSGGIGSDYACFEVNDIDDGDANHLTQNLTIRDCLFSSVSGTGTWGLYLASGTKLACLTLDDCAYSNIENALVGAVNHASAVLDGIWLRNPIIRDDAPANGIVNLQNTQNSTSRILRGDIDCRGMILTTVGTIDSLVILRNPTTPTLGGTGNANKAVTLTSSGLQIGNNQILYGLDSTGAQKTLLVISSGNVVQVGSTTNANNLVGTSVNLVQAGTSVVLSVTSDTNVTLGLGARATNATVGFPYIPVMAGAASGTPTSISGMAPMVWDTTNLRLQIYDPTAAAWKSALFS